MHKIEVPEFRDFSVAPELMVSVTWAHGERLFRDQQICDAGYIFFANSSFNCLMRKTASVVDLPPIKPNYMSSIFISCPNFF